MTTENKKVSWNSADYRKVWRFVPHDEQESKQMNKILRRVSKLLPQSVLAYIKSRGNNMQIVCYKGP